MDAGLSGSSFQRGDGPKPVPDGTPPLWGATIRAASLVSVQALPIGTATKRVPWFDFTRINTLRLPSLWASETALRTSAGEDTVLPLTSRMTSPVWTRSPAVPLGS